jgi:hypothetical protein
MCRRRDSVGIMAEDATPLCLDGRYRRVLVVDDDADALKSLERELCKRTNVVSVALSANSNVGCSRILTSPQPINGAGRS